MNRAGNSRETCRYSWVDSCVILMVSWVRGPGFDTRSGNILLFLLPLFQEGQLSVTGKSSNRLGGLSLPRKSVVKLTDRPDMTLDIYRGRKTTMQQRNEIYWLSQTLQKFGWIPKSDFEHLIFKCQRHGRFSPYVNNQFYITQFQNVILVK